MESKAITFTLVIYFHVAIQLLICSAYFSVIIFPKLKILNNDLILFYLNRGVEKGFLLFGCLTLTF